MIQTQTMFRLGDNSGVQSLRSIKIKPYPRGGQAKLGQDLLVSIRRLKSKATQRYGLRKGDKLRGFILHTRAIQRRKNGLNLCFGNNRALCFTKNQKVLGSRVFYPLPIELRKRKFMKVVSMAPIWV